MPRVSALYIYPIKSCGGIPVTSAKMHSRGLEFDRRYMLVDGNGRFLTQRQMPRMALLNTRIDAGLLRVMRPDGEELELPLRPAFREIVPVKIWRSRLDACAAGERVNAWFSEFLERPVRLVYMADDQHRSVSRERATRRDDEVSFADGAPVLLIGEGSLGALNARLRQSLSMRRFRPNIVVDSAQAFLEDRWRRVRIGETALEVAWSCSRCTITTVDPETGIADVHGEPLRTLREFRRYGAGVVFGQNLLIRGSGTVSVGDQVEVIESI